MYTYWICKTSTFTGTCNTYIVTTCCFDFRFAAQMLWPISALVQRILLGNDHGKKNTGKLFKTHVCVCTCMHCILVVIESVEQNWSESHYNTFDLCLTSYHLMVVVSHWNVHALDSHRPCSRNKRCFHDGVSTCTCISGK